MARRTLFGLARHCFVMVAYQCIRRKKAAGPVIGFVYGLVAPVTFVYVPLTAGAPCRLKVELVQLKTTFPPTRCTANGMGVATVLMSHARTEFAFVESLINVGVPFVRLTE